VPESVSQSPPSLLPPGTVVDDYVIEELFFIGASSVVYRARQPSLDRTVVLKILPKERTADQRWTHQFRQGARLLASITHPSIIPVYGYGEHEGSEYIAMMLVPGARSLDRAFRPPLDDAALAGLLRAGLDVARALQFIHERGLVHGDIKPSNILVSGEGRAFLIDFDFAKRRGEITRINPADVLASGFLAPEVLTAQDAADHRADLYSLGASLYAGMAGGPPRKDSPIPLEHVCPAAPANVCSLIHRCLETDVSARFPDAGNLADELADLVAGFAHPAPGRTLGPFRILTEIGRGGMGVVFKAIQEPLGREIALKVLPPEFSASASRVKRFQLEAEAVSKLDHPHIIPIYACGRFGGYHYYAMKLVRGGTLAKTVGAMRGSCATEPGSGSFAVQFASAADARAAGAGPQPGAPAAPSAPAPGVPPASAHVGRMVTIALKVADALAHAHEQGILHRDVKPANIMVDDERGEPYVVDFGLARDESETGVNDSLAFCGTPSYMAPEQVAGAGVDRRTDVWGLGVTLYEVLSLRQPFSGPSRDAVFDAIRTTEAPPLRSLNPAVDRDLEAVVHTAMERDPSRRYRDMRAFADDLRAVLEGRHPVARRAGFAGRLFRKAQRHRVSTGVLLIVVVVIAAICVLVGFELA
jgi:serine/threonine protein kinase